mmetsp:Transcript_20704/g.42666  ORF Transcript_20704/g.42666 Transcript_20704/m.42666 type:complete len:211 (-) Transcript_20704:272-904(-)
MNSHCNVDDVQDLTRSAKRRLSLVDPSDGCPMTPALLTSRKQTRTRSSKEPPSTHRPVKSVRFSEFSSLTTFSRNSAKDARSAWYSKQEIDDLKLVIRDEAVVLRGSAAVHQMEKLAHSILAPDEYEGRPELHVIEDVSEIRGIEHILSSQVLRVIFHQRKAALARLLQEQRMQRALGVRDELRLAEVCQQYSAFSREWSYAIANAKSEE